MGQPSLRVQVPSKFDRILAHQLRWVSGNFIRGNWYFDRTGQFGLSVAMPGAASYTTPVNSSEISLKSGGMGFARIILLTCHKNQILNFDYCTIASLLETIFNTDRIEGARRLFLLADAVKCLDIPLLGLILRRSICKEILWSIYHCTAIFHSPSNGTVSRYRVNGFIMQLTAG